METQVTQRTQSEHNGHEEIHVANFVFLVVLSVLCATMIFFKNHINCLKSA